MAISLQDKKRTPAAGQIFRQLRAISGPQKAAFLSAFIFGVVVHFDVLASGGKISNPDTIMYGTHQTAWAWDISLGRWGFAAGTRLAFNNRFLPTMNTFLAILCIALSAFLVVRLLGMRTRAAAALIGCVMTCYPALSNIMPQTYYSFFMMSALLCSVLAVCAVVWLGKFGFVPGAIFLALAMSIYQSYLAFTVALALIVLIIQLLDNQTKLRQTGMIALRLVIMGTLGGFLYAGGTVLVCSLRDIALSSYGGASEWGGFLSTNIFASIATAYRNTAHVFLNGFSIYMLGSHSLWMLILAGGGLAATGIAAYRNGLYKNKPRTLLLVLGFILLPLAVSVMWVLLPSGHHTSTTTLYPYVLLLVLIVLLLERTWSGLKAGTVIKVVPILCLCYVLFSQWAFTATVYSALRSTYNKMESTAIRVIDRVETNERYEPGMPIAIIGSVTSENYPLPTSVYYEAGVALDTLVWGGEATPFGWKNFYEVHLGLVVNMDLYNAYREHVGDDYIADMPSFPSEGSVQVIEGHVIVKLS